MRFRTLLLLAMLTTTTLIYLALVSPNFPSIKGVAVTLPVLVFYVAVRLMEGFSQEHLEIKLPGRFVLKATRTSFRGPTRARRLPRLFSDAWFDDPADIVRDGQEDAQRNQKDWSRRNGGLRLLPALFRLLVTSGLEALARRIRS